MKFTDMNFDCLEAVLEYLELIDLLNVADSTKRLNKAAELVFARKYGNKTMEIQIRQISQNQAFVITDKEIFINDLKTALQLLRCSGPVISTIILEETTGGKYISEIDVKVVRYINQYCADYLKKLEIVQYRSDRNDLLNYFDRPFPKLTIFYNQDSVFTENVCLNRLFPKMRRLHIYHINHINNFSFYNFNTKHFPYLEELRICDGFATESFLFNQIVINLLQRNPQIKDLTIWSAGKNCILNTDLIRNAVDSLQNVESLKLNLMPITFLDDSDNVIQMKSVKHFSIRFDSYYFEISPYLLPFSFENLEEFRIIFPKPQFVNGSFNDQFFNFIDRHSSMMNLLIGGIERCDVVNWSRLATSLPLLLEIEIVDCYISADEAIEIMAKFKMLNKFGFRLKDDYDNFRKHLATNWDAIYVMNKRIVKLHRKI